MSVFFYLFIIVGLINLFHIAAFVIGGNIYDAKAIAGRRRYNRQKRHRFRNPLISVLIPAFNEELSIARCLESVQKNSYKKIEIIVNNDASTDATAEIVKRYQKDHPSLNLRLVNRRHNLGKAVGLNYIAERYAKGELVMTIDADSILHKKALANVVKYFDDPEIAGVAANVRVMEEFSTLGLLQRFEHMVAYRSKKLYTLINCEIIVGGVASTYRRDVLKKVRFYDFDTVTEDIGLSLKVAKLGNKQYRLIYASDVVAMTEGVHSFKALLAQRFRWKLGSLQNLVKQRRLLFSINSKYSLSLTWYRVPMAYFGEMLILVEPILFGYVIYLSVRYLTPAILFSAYTLITIYLLLIILPDEHLSWRQKVQSSLIAPFMYFLFYIMNVVQLVSAVRCLINPRRVIKLNNQPNTWVSPARSGRIASSQT